VTIPIAHGEIDSQLIFYVVNAVFDDRESVAVIRNY